MGQPIFHLASERWVRSGLATQRLTKHGHSLRIVDVSPFQRRECRVVAAKSVSETLPKAGHHSLTQASAGTAQRGQCQLCEG
ncbi:hypothetical protein ADK52_12875 [Streptomyces sp. WM6372]|nr:hypothetical protein ADK52_12875 [Streptomyces sp. WM6372]